jgi:hypothetical protein
MLNLKRIEEEFAIVKSIKVHEVSHWNSAQVVVQTNPILPLLARDVFNLLNNVKPRRVNQHQAKLSNFLVPSRSHK